MLTSKALGIHGRKLDVEQDDNIFFFTFLQLLIDLYK